MDVEAEFRAMQKRIQGDTYKRVLEARRRIWEPTVTEQWQMKACGDPSPKARQAEREREAFNAAMARVGEQIRQFVDAVKAVLL